MNKSACGVVICQPGGREQKHDTKIINYCIIKAFLIMAGLGNLPTPVHINLAMFGKPPPPK